MATISPPRSPSTQEHPPRRPSGGWIAAVVLLVIALIAIPVAIFVMNGDEPVTTTTGAPTTTAPGTATTVPPTTLPPVAIEQDAVLFYLADYVEAGTPGPHLIATLGTASVAVPEDAEDVVRGAVKALLSGPSSEISGVVAGVSSAIPPGSELLGATLDVPARTVSLDFNSVFASGGGTFSMGARLAQVVYTATAVDGIDDVLFLIDGSPVDVFSSEGIVLDGPQNRDGYRDIVPPILVEAPPAGAVVSSPASITGVANVFEAAFMYAIEDASGNRIAEAPAMASCGTGCWGDFDISQPYSLSEAQPGTIVLWVNSARDGLPENIVRIPVTLQAGDTGTAFVLDIYAETPGGAPLFGSYVTEPVVAVSGTTNVGAAVTVNGIAVQVDPTGFFSVDVALDPGRNDISFVVAAAGETFERHGVVTYAPDASVEFGYTAMVTFDPEGQLTSDVGEGGPWSMLVDVDRAEWLTGEAANQAAREDGVIGDGETVPNDYYIRNADTATTRYPVSSEAAIVLQTAADGPVGPAAVTMGEWSSLFKADGTPWNAETDSEFPEWPAPHFGYLGAGMFGSPYWFVIDADGEILQIVQQYRP